MDKGLSDYFGIEPQGIREVDDLDGVEHDMIVFGQAYVVIRKPPPGGQQ